MCSKATPRTWVEGDDLEKVLPTLPKEEQYRLGREAGGILRRIHLLPLDAADVPEETKKERKLRQLERYEASDVRIPGDEGTIAFVRENIDAIWTQPPVYLHGDFHPGNLVYRRDGSLGVIDFNRWEVGDPYEGFYKLECFGVEAARRTARDRSTLILPETCRKTSGRRLPYTAPTRRFSRSSGRSRLVQGMSPK